MSYLFPPGSRHPSVGVAGVGRRGGVSQGDLHVRESPQVAGRGGRCLTCDLRRGLGIMFRLAFSTPSESRTRSLKVISLVL